VVVFMTQDALLADPGALVLLAAVFENPSVACVYGRQLPHTDATPVAAHARLFNYPAESRVVSLVDKERLGLKTCFMSNSFAAYRVADLQAVGGFPSNVILGEDMSVAARLLMAGKRVAYVADACVHHSHNYSLPQEFRRYFDTGVFHARSPWLLQNFGTVSGEGLRFVRSELAYLLRHAPGWIPSAMVRTFAKLLGYRLGRLEALWPVWFKRWCSMHKGFWA
jgi:rhamnosyltransferase